MQVISHLKRQDNIKFAVGMASLDGGKPSAFTEGLLKKYENGSISSKELKENIIKEYESNKSNT